MSRRKKAKAEMLITILGCGTSVGVPMIGLRGARFKNPKNQRLRVSCLIEPFGRGGPNILIDTSPDLRQQVQRFFPKTKPHLDIILLTHYHADHLHGLDDIRPFNFYQKHAIPLYAQEETLEAVKRKFDYIFQAIQIGGGLPQLTLHKIAEEPFFLNEAKNDSLKKIKIIPLPLIHGKIIVLGFRIGNMAYLTDCNAIPEDTLEKLQGLDVLILDCLRPKPHSTHLHIAKAIEYAYRINAKKTFFTHMGNEIDYEKFQKSLPSRMHPSYDGQQIRIAR